MNALDAVWSQLDIRRTTDWAAKGGFVGVGVENKEIEQPLWTDEQLGLTEISRELKAGGPLGAMEAVLEHETKQTAGAVSAAA